MFRSKQKHVDAIGHLYPIHNQFLFLIPNLNSNKLI